MPSDDAHRRRMGNALWGLFVADALAMPAHWYYRLDNIEKDFDGGVSGYADPPHPHPESFMVGMAYQPDVATAKRLGRPYDILHEHARFYQTSYSSIEIDRSERESEHGNVVPKLEDRYHYHHGLKAGENTVGAQLVRVLLRSVAERGRYDQERFLAAFVEHFATPGRNRDPYTEIYIRRWFESFSQGLPAHACAEQQRNVWSIGSHGGVIRPLVVSLLAGSAYQGLGLAIEHQNLTHRSENVSSALGVLVPLLHQLVDGAEPQDAIATHARDVRVPQVTGEELFAAYRDAQGPGNIPTEEMWRLHTALADAPFEVDRFEGESGETEVVRERLASACYTEHGVPLLLYFAHNQRADFKASLLANANGGGDNVHRGMLLGMVVGAAHEELPADLLEGLAAHAELQAAIDAFTDVAVSGTAI